jgi:hypothetical protein
VPIGTAKQVGCPFPCCSEMIFEDVYRLAEHMQDEHQLVIQGGRSLTDRAKSIQDHPDTIWIGISGGEAFITKGEELSSEGELECRSRDNGNLTLHI